MYPTTAGIVIQTKELWEELKGALASLPVRIVLEQSDIPDLESLVEKVERVRPEIVFLDFAACNEFADHAIRRIRTCNVNPAVFAINRTADPDKILNAMRAGASEFLYAPFGDQLVRALERVTAERQQVSQSLRAGGKTVGFLSAKGGCGATTIACHLAAELPKQSRGKVLLADVDLESGMVGFLLKSKSPYTIADAIRNTGRLDENYWKALVSNGISGLEVISAPVPSSRPAIDPERLKYVVNFVRNHYDWSILDLGRGLNATSGPILEDLDHVFIVTTLEIPALHQSKLIAQKLLETRLPQRVQLLLNRAPKRFEVTTQELESMVGVPVFYTMPNDYGPLNESYTEGKLLTPNSKLGQHFTRLAMKLAGTDEQPKKKFSIFG